MAIIPIGNQLINSNGLPLDARTVIEGSMSEEYNNLPDCYEGMLVYSEYDSKIYLVTEVDDNKYIQSYIPIYDSTLDKLIFSDIDNDHIITISKGKIVISNSYLGSEYTITIEKDIELSVDGTIHKLSNKIDDVPTDDKKYIRIKGQWIEASNDIDIDDFSRKIYITQDATSAYVKYAVDSIHQENDIELFRIESVDAEIDNIAGLMYPEDKRKLDKIDVEQLNEKVGKAESAATSASETLADIDESIKKLIESDPDATDDEVLKNTVAATALKVSKIGISSANDETDADLNITDRNGNILMQLKNGHIKTKNFDSSNINNDNNSSADCSTKNGYIADIFLKYHAIGDSITAGQGTTEGNRYFEILKPLCNFENVTSDAAGGLTLVENINYFLSRIPSDAELVSIFLGTNDFGHNIQLGTMDSSVGSDDFYGKLKYACEYMLTNKPNVKYFFICPISRVGEDNNNATGHKLADYVNAIKEVCGTYNVPYIDLFSGKNAKGLTAYTGDGLHPNAEGHKILAFQISKFINNKL